MTEPEKDGFKFNRLPGEKLTPERVADMLPVAFREMLSIVVMSPDIGPVVFAAIGPNNAARLQEFDVITGKNVRKRRSKPIGWVDREKVESMKETLIDLAPPEETNLYDFTEFGLEVSQVCNRLWPSEDVGHENIEGIKRRYEKYLRHIQGSGDLPDLRDS